MPQGDLAVGADVHEQAQFASARHGGRQETRHDVAPDVGADGGEQVDPPLRVDGDPDLARLEVDSVRGGRGERCHGDGLRVDPHQEVDHGQVAGHRDLVEPGGGHPGLGGHPLDDPVDGEGGEVLQLLEPLLLPHGVGDARQDVAAVDRLGVQCRDHGAGLAVVQVHQRTDDGCGAEVEGDAVALARGVARLDGDQGLAGQDRGHIEFGPA